MSGFKLAPLSLIVGSLFVVNAVQAQDFTLDGSSADVTQNVTAEDKITSLNVSGGHTGTITGETITISGTGNVANVTTAGHPTATVSRHGPDEEGLHHDGQGLGSLQQWIQPDGAG